MPLVKAVRSRGATTTVEANVEVMFVPTGSISRWERRLSRAVTEATRRAAPRNKRPHWMHYGKKLSDFGAYTTKTKYSGTHITSVVGSRVSHALYPDQGTGIYAGKSPWRAKILPPRTEGGSDLYEATWRPRRDSAPQGGITVKGQRGQFFFDKGLRNALTSMRLPSVEVADAVVANKTRGGSTQALVNSLGLPVDPQGAFQTQLEQWREWRDDAFQSETRPRNRKSRAIYPSRIPRLSPDERKARNRINSKRYRDSVRDYDRSLRAKTKAPIKPAKPKRVTKPKMGKTDQNAFISAMSRKYGWVDRNTLEIRGGYYYIVVRVKGEGGRTEYREVRGKIKN